MTRTLRNLARLLAIARILARHNSLFLLERLQVAAPVLMLARLFSRKAEGRPGQRLATALQEAGPSFIKLGQALSTRSDLLGEEFATDLSALQDRLPPFPGDQAIKIIEREFGKPLDQLFSGFDTTPVAAASIAQVHFAETLDGREVAVKVLRPGIEQAFARDLELFSWVAELVEAARPEFRRLRPVASVATLADTVKLEMDLRFEAAAAAELGENFKDDPDFTVPKVDWVLTGLRVLTTERVYGVPMDDVEAIRGFGLNPTAVLEKSSAAFFQQVYRDGFFHADLHPGNMFVRQDGGLAVVDFGIMGRLDRTTRRHLGEMLLAFLSRDYRRVAEVHFEAGWIGPEQSVDTFTQACRSIAEPILDLPQNEISIARLLGQLFSITEKFDMETQPQLLLLQKTMLIAEGTGRTLDPEANMWFLARPLIEDLMRQTLGPEARIVDAVADFAVALRRLPSLLENLEKGVAELAGGGLKLHPETIRALRGGKKTLGLGPITLIATAAVLVSLLAVILD